MRAKESQIPYAGETACGDDNGPIMAGRHRGTASARLPARGRCAYAYRTCLHTQRPLAILATVASYLPAWNASRLTVREVLAYE